MRKLDYYIAVSVDNFIAKPDGSVDGFLGEGDHIQPYIDSLRNYDTVLMGRSTYEFAYQFGLRKGQPVPMYGHMKQYVISSTIGAFDHPQIEVVSQDVSTFLANLKDQEGLDIYLCGGGTLAAYLIEHGLIDRLILKRNPVLFGDGIPLFHTLGKEQPVNLENCIVYGSGVIFEHYSVT